MRPRWLADDGVGARDDRRQRALVGAREAHDGEPEIGGRRDRVVDGRGERHVHAARGERTGQLERADRGAEHPRADGLGRDDEDRRGHGDHYSLGMDTLPGSRGPEPGAPAAPNARGVAETGVATIVLAVCAGLQGLLFLDAFGIDARTDAFFAAYALYVIVSLFGQTLRTSAVPLLAGAGGRRAARDRRVRHRRDRARARGARHRRGGRARPRPRGRARARRGRPRGDRDGAADPRHRHGAPGRGGRRRDGGRRPRLAHVAGARLRRGRARGARRLPRPPRPGRRAGARLVDRGRGRRDHRVARAAPARLRRATRAPARRPAPPRLAGRLEPAGHHALGPLRADARALHRRGRGGGDAARVRLPAGRLRQRRHGGAARAWAR